MALADARASVVEDASLHGTQFARALSFEVDQWLRDLYEEKIGDRPGVALIAVGGYGREELCPHSDLDVLLVHRLDEAEISEIAGELWYPIWDEGAKLGHSVRTVSEALDLAGTDLDTATSLLTARRLCGDLALFEKLGHGALATWQKQGRKWIPELYAAAEGRRESAGEIAFMLEPDLKEGRGGLRDVHALKWAAMTQKGAARDTPVGLEDQYEVILRARVELHRCTGRRGGDALLLEQQDAVAEALGYGDADDLMADIASAGRRIAWHGDEIWTQWLDKTRRRVPQLRRRSAAANVWGVSTRSGRVGLEDTAPVAPEAVLSAAVTAAQEGLRFSPATITRLERASLEVSEPWSDDVRELFVQLLSLGHEAIPVIETLDQLGLFVPFIPEWATTRSKPQRNAYHRFTVDRHLWETAAEASAFVDEVSRPDLLLVGALLHDIGKGYPGDHTEVGMELIPTIAARMGFPAEDAAVLVAMCRHHLLLPDVATRRDIDDDDTIQAVADEVVSVDVLHLLRALTEADSVATGPAAWSSWKAGLVRDLAGRVEYVLQGGDARELPRNFPTDDHREAMRRGTVQIRGEGEVLTVMAMDRPGVFSRVAGAVSLNNLDVLEAAAHSEFGIALAMFSVQPRFADDIDWDQLCRSVEDALHGRTALAARIDERINTYAPRRTSTSPRPIVETSITIDNETSSSATVIEVASPNRIGLLYYVTRAFSQLDLNIASAKVQTLGDHVVDSFYLSDRDGGRITDEAVLGEVKKALEHAIRLTGATRDTNDG